LVNVCALEDSAAPDWDHFWRKAWVSDMDWWVSVIAEREDTVCR